MGGDDIENGREDHSMTEGISQSIKQIEIISTNQYKDNL